MNQDSKTKTKKTMNTTTKKYQITFEDIFSFALSVRIAELTEGQFKNTIEKIKSKTIVIDRFIKEQGIKQQLIIKSIKSV